MTVELGIIVCRRKLRTPVDDEVEILLGMPQQYEAEVDFYCPYQVVGIGDDGVYSAAGVDTLQALMLALLRIYSKLSGSCFGKSGQLRWMEGDEIVDDGDNFGFPEFFPKY